MRFGILAAAAAMVVSAPASAAEFFNFQQNGTLAVNDELYLRLIPTGLTGSFRFSVQSSLPINAYYSTNELVEFEQVDRQGRQIARDDLFIGVFGNSFNSSNYVSTHYATPERQRLPDGVTQFNMIAYQPFEIRLRSLFSVPTTYSLSLVGIAPAVVPEPATWAMMILGLGGVGGAMRRRSNIRHRTKSAVLPCAA